MRALLVGVCLTAVLAHAEPPKTPTFDAIGDVPEAARAVVQEFALAMENGDAAKLASLGGKGIKKGKTTIAPADLANPKKTGIKPWRNCTEPESEKGVGATCQWGPWIVTKKTKTSFLIYADNDSGYGTFQGALFAKKGDTWAWTEIRAYDTGEP